MPPRCPGTLRPVRPVVRRASGSGMGQRSVRVVVGQGDLDHERSLRAVLERDGVDVVGEASNASQLARVLTDEQPDIVVLDDVIGISAVELTTQIVPEARLVVVWPAAVMPLAAAVRVAPSEVATPLDAAAKLAARATDAAAAAVVPIGLAASQREEPSAEEEGAAAATVAPAVLSSAWNRRLGIISLGGAAAAGALMIALALGPHGSSINSAEPFVPPSTQQGGGPAVTPGGGTQ